MRCSIQQFILFFILLLWVCSGGTGEQRCNMCKAGRKWTVIKLHCSGEKCFSTVTSYSAPWNWRGKDVIQVLGSLKDCSDCLSKPTCQVFVFKVALESSNSCCLFLGRLPLAWFECVLVSYWVALGMIWMHPRILLGCFSTSNSSKWIPVCILFQYPYTFCAT